jgi:hypothetical protein
MDKARRLNTVAWSAVSALAVAGLVYAGVMAWMVLSTVNWDLFDGKLDWSPGQTVGTAPPQIPPGAQLPPQGVPAPPPGFGGPQAPPPGLGGPQVPPSAQLPRPPAPQLPPPPRR